MFLSLLTAILLVNIFVLIIIICLYRTLKTQQKYLKRQIQLLENFSASQTYKNEHLIGEWKSYVFLQALQAREAIFKQINNLHPKVIEDAPTSHGLTNKELTAAFTPEQIEAITLFWKLFQQYVDTYWKTDQGKIKTVFKGAVDLKGSEVHTVQTVSKQLITKLDRLLKQMKGVEH